MSLYHVDGVGQLRRWSHNDPLIGNTTQQQSLLDQDWEGISTISGGDGVIYTITSTGDLLWHKDNNFNGSGGPAWNPNSGTRIGVGWSGFDVVVGAGDGVIYGIAPNGNLYWYRHLGQNGESTWVSGKGRLVGVAWNNFSHLASSGNGVLYTVTSAGDLRWYRHRDPLGGAWDWANGGSGVRVGTGWAQFTRLGSFGAGVLLARNSTGSILWYRHLDPLGGTVSWAGGSGKALGTGWNNGQLVADVTGCRAT